MSILLLLTAVAQQLRTPLYICGYAITTNWRSQKMYIRNDIMGLGKHKEKFCCYFLMSSKFNLIRTGYISTPFNKASNLLPHGNSLTVFYLLIKSLTRLPLIQLRVLLSVSLRSPYCPSLSRNFSTAAFFAHLHLHIFDSYFFRFIFLFPVAVFHQTTSKVKNKLAFTAWVHLFCSFIWSF